MRQGRESEATEDVFCLQAKKQAKKPLHRGSYEHRVPKIKNQNIFLYTCLIQHRNWPLRSTILNAHDTMPVRTGSVHAHILTKPSRAVLLQFV